MFGPAFLVAPVTEQGATSRAVYLPAGTAWYNYWTSERFDGGRTITVNAPIDTIPLFVRAGSILPLGEAIESTSQTQKVWKVRVYPGSDGDFALYQDDGKTYGYENGKFQVTKLHWDNAAAKLSHTGEAAWAVPDAQVVEVVGR
jgi:alpha-D-xyloside xylohydrolase